MDDNGMIVFLKRHKDELTFDVEIEDSETGFGLERVVIIIDKMSNQPIFKVGFPEDSDMSDEFINNIFK